MSAASLLVYVMGEKTQTLLYGYFRTIYASTIPPKLTPQTDLSPLCLSIQFVMWPLIVPRMILSVLNLLDFTYHRTVIINLKARLHTYSFSI